jgi:MarR family transcriptional regulator, organic hydroperoxide resistance regulator
VSAAVPGASAETIAARIEELLRVLHPLNQPAPPWLDQELTFSQFRVLYLLGEQGPLPMSRLAEFLDVTPATATGVIERLEKRGLAARSHRGDDRRVVECSLSHAGRQMVGAATGARIDDMRQWLSVLTPDELAQLDQLLANVIERLSAR